MTKPNDVLPNGLTKREHVAVEAMKSILSRGSSSTTSPLWAIEATDILIRELNKPK